MKVVFFICIYWMIGFWVMAEDAVLIRLNGKEVCKSEFMWYIHRSSETERVDDIFNQFVEFQLKVADAEKCRLDTFPDFRRQCSFLQSKILRKHFVNQQIEDSCCHKLLADMENRRVEKQWVRMDVFTLHMSQNVPPSEENTAGRIMYEWKKRLQVVSNPNVDELTWASENGVTKQLDAEMWVPMNHLLYEMIQQQSSLEIGCWSEPFSSPYGLHIIRVAERRHTFGKEWYPNLQRYLDQKEHLFPLLNRQAYTDWEDEKSQSSIELKRELLAIRDGLLAVYWDQKEQTNSLSPSSISTETLETFYRDHKHNYRWEFPHFKGAVVHCLTKKAASKIKKRLKKLPMALWKEALQRMQQEDSDYRGELEIGLFQIGRNPYIDYLAFKCGNSPSHEKYPYTFLVGKKLKKGPENYTDVLSKVIADYIKQHKKDRFSQLFASFDVEINKDVLKTVNSCGNK